ncbi:MAG: PAS domain S-box protein [Fusobacteriaceae bacterium]|nr:PAS domain S-box protein [Fusobacteriaceae bacterium]MBP9595823.1 PAS domain S-box protein [Fusobacteriaceae bacterium]MBU9918909.1 PAS domain S-box protein [Fusobacteriaceae bacterium]
MTSTLYILIILLLFAQLIFLSVYTIKLKKKIDYFNYHEPLINSIKGIAIIVTDTKGIIKSFNKDAEKLLQYKANEVIEKENFIIFHDKEELRKRSKYLSKKLHKHIEGFETIIIYNDSNGLVNTEWTFIQKTGSKILVDLNISSVNNENSDIIGYICSIKNLNNKLSTESQLKNEIHSLYKNLNDKSKEVLLLNSELRTVTYNLSHSIKTPLHGINQISQWLKEDYKDSIGSDAQELLNMLIYRVEKLNAIIDNLLEYTDIKVKLEKLSKLDLNYVLKNLINFLNVPQNIEINIARNMPHLKIEKKYIESIFTNLIENSIKFMDKEKGRIEVGFVELNKEYMFFIRDNGPGIEEKYFEKIFTMFHSINNNESIENLGVGLALTKKIVELHGGTIHIESKIKEGTTVFFTLPYENVN